MGYKHYLARLKNKFSAPPKQKTYEAWFGKGYLNEPEVSFIIQSHNKGPQVIELVNKLRETKNSEIIVIDDGSDINHTSKLVNHLTKGNEFLIRFNDLYEVITYDRCIYFARGKYVALLQDDDKYANENWIVDAIKLFKQHPKLVILGGRLGGKILPFESTVDNEVGEYEFKDGIGQRKNLLKYDLSSTLNPNSQFHFVDFVNRAPMWINRELFIEKLQHIDQDYAPFHTDDAELCLRAWLSGLQVGWYSANVETGAAGDGGMRIWNQTLHKRQVIENYKLLYNKYLSRLDDIHELTKQANNNN